MRTIVLFLLLTGCGATAPTSTAAADTEPPRVACLVNGTVFVACNGTGADTLCYETPTGSVCCHGSEAGDCEAGQRCNVLGAASGVCQ